MINNKITLLLSIFITIMTAAQKDTIAISQFKTTQIIFNDDVELVEAGTGDLQVKTKTLENILILQSVVPSDDFLQTNLFIKTKSKIYNILLKYTEDPKVSTILENSLKPSVELGSSGAYSTAQLEKGTNQPKKQDVSEKKQSSDYNGIRTTEGKAIVQKLLNRNDVFKPSRQYQTGVWFRFYAHYIIGNHYFFKFEMDNETDLTYAIDHIFFSVKNRKKRNSSDTQREISPIRFVNETPEVDDRSKRFLIFEFDTFSINPDEELLVEVKEKQGSRNFQIGIPYYIINKPIKL